MIARQSRYAAELNPDSAERFIRQQLRIQGDNMRRRGVPDDLIAHELQCMEAAISHELQASVSTGGANFYPNLRKIELYAKAAREGWECWGHEAPENDMKKGYPEKRRPRRQNRTRPKLLDGHSPRGRASRSATKQIHLKERFTCSGI
jgi:hypothetical protein